MDTYDLVELWNTEYDDIEEEEIKKAKTKHDSVWMNIYEAEMSDDETNEDSDLSSDSESDSGDESLSEDDDEN